MQIQPTQIQYFGTISFAVETQNCELLEVKKDDHLLVSSAFWV